MNLRIRNCPMVDAELEIGGDKSITHRALMLGALAEGRTEIKGYSRCRDCRTTMKVLRNLGVSIEEEDDKIIIQGNGRYGFSEPEDLLDCENSGTTMRLLSGILSGQKFYSVLIGDNSLRKRPMDRIIIPLQRMGAQIMARNHNRFPPISIRGGNLKGIRYELPVASAQVKSSILLAGLYTDGVIVKEPSPTRDHTERLLNLFGLRLLEKENEIVLDKPSRELKSQHLIIPGDISSASFFMVMGAIVGPRIRLMNVGLNPTRTGIIDILKKMGLKVVIENRKEVCNEPVGDILVETDRRLNPITVSGSMIPKLIDELPVLAVAATQADGISVIKDAKELRLKETDRIKAIVQGLRAMNARIQETPDGFVIEGPNRLRGARCNSFGDHRIAMSLAVAGLCAEGETTIEDGECINISFPEFMTNVKRICGEAAIEDNV